jgi:hypothetical protein
MAMALTSESLPALTSKKKDDPAFDLRAQQCFFLEKRKL